MASKNASHRLRSGLLGIGLLLPACIGAGSFFESIDERTCPSEGTELTYDGFGRGFLVAHCQRCHGSHVTDREGAPGEFIFDTHEQAVRHRVRIYARSAAGNDSMPPGPDDPPRDQREQLAEWLVCGAP